MLSGSGRQAGQCSQVPSILCVAASLVRSVQWTKSEVEGITSVPRVTAEGHKDPGKPRDGRTWKQPEARSLCMEVNVDRLQGMCSV